MTSPTFKHSTLGTFHGVKAGEGVVQYRCIPFARIPARFQHSQLIDHVGDFDATKYGPVCPQMLGLVENQARGWGIEGGPVSEALEEDELGCLRLTISAPEGHKEGQNLPVMVWVHGGAMTAGAGASVPKESLHHLVELSAKRGTPVIGVAIQYRLGWLGFLASKDFEQEEEHFQDGLGPGNWGIIDQRNAFIWIKKHIAEFGGESAGSISIAYHMCSTVPNLFSRAILQSGIASSLTPLSLETYDNAYRNLLGLLDIPATDSLEVRLRKLRSVPVHKFIESYKHLYIDYPAFPAVEGSWFWKEPVDGKTGVEVLAKCDWVNEIIIGDCLVEGKIFQLNVSTDKPDPLTALQNSAKKILPESPTVDAIFKAYSLVPGTPMEKICEQATLLSGDLMFQQMIRDTAKSLVKAGKKVYYYHWDYPNPWPAPFFGGVAHHFVDCLFLFQTLQSIYPTPLARKVAEDMATYWLTFVVSGVPEGWKEYNEGYVAVVDPEAGWTQRTVEEDRRSPLRREDMWDLIAEVQPWAQMWGDQMCNRRDGFWK